MLLTHSELYTVWDTVSVLEACGLSDEANLLLTSNRKGVCEVLARPYVQMAAALMGYALPRFE